MNANLSDKDNQVVLGILSEELEVSKDQIKGDARLVDDLGADSLTLIEIAMLLEERFNVTFPDERIERVSTVNDLYDALAEAMQPAERRV